MKLENLLHTMPHSIQTGIRLNLHYSAHQKNAEARENYTEGFRPVGPVPTSIETFLDAELRDQFPESWARKRLSEQGIEAVRAVTGLNPHGNFAAAGEVLFLWPLQPSEGFATAGQIAGVDHFDKESRPDGSIKLTAGIVMAGRRYKEGDLIQLWPERPLPGFIRAEAALELLQLGKVEPAEISEITAE